MLEDLQSNFTRLISLYETQKQRADALAERLAQEEAQSQSYREQIEDLNHQIDTLRLSGAFVGGGDNRDAKERLDKLIREIDKCIKLLEK